MAYYPSSVPSKTLVDKEELFFVVEEYQTLFFSEHFNAYVVELVDKSVTVNQRLVYISAPSCS